MHPSNIDQTPKNNDLSLRNTIIRQPACTPAQQRQLSSLLARRQILQTAIFLQIILSLTFPFSSQAFSSESMNAVNNNSSSCPNSTKVFVIGANGKTGFRLVQLLKQSPFYQPMAMIRDAASQSRRFEDIDVPWIVGDVEKGAPTAEDLEGYDAVIFAAGAGRERPNIKKVTIDYLGAVKSMAACQETASVRRFVLLSGINSDARGTRRSANAAGEELSGPLSAWHRLKAHSEAYVKTSHLHGRPVDWTILCPGRLVDDESGEAGTGLIKASLIHGEDDLRESLTREERSAASKTFPGSHDGKMERLCISRDNTAAALVGLLSASNTIGKSVTVVDGILPVDEALSEID